MGLFTSQEFNSLQQLLEHQLKDLYDAELRLTEAIPKMSTKAHSQDLKKAFDSHLRETESQVKRLESAFQQLGIEPERAKCEAMAGLIAEGEEILKAKGDDDVLDAALIAAAQRIEHYEIAGYGVARSFAERVGRADVARLLQESLDEEGGADKQLTQIAERAVNPAAV